MRTVGLVYVVAFVVVLAAVRLQAGTEAPPAVAPPDPSALAPVAESLPSTATEPIRADDAVGTVLAEAAQSEDPTRQTVAPPVPSKKKLPAPEPQSLPRAHPHSHAWLFLPPWIYPVATGTREALNKTGVVSWYETTGEL